MSVSSLLAWCAAHDGREPERFNNIDVFWDWYRSIYGLNFQGSAWCGAAAAVGYTWGGGWKPPSQWISVNYVESWGKVHGRWHYGSASLAPGDAVVLFGPGIHTGICASYPRYGSLKTYEGNTSKYVWGSQANGGGYFSKTRYTGNIFGYVRLHDVIDTHLVAKPVPSFHLKPLPLALDGDFGPQTIGQLQHATGAGVDGVFGFGSKAALQRHLHVKADGQIGQITVSALQSWLNRVVAAGMKVNGIWGHAVTTNIQRALNRRVF